MEQKQRGPFVPTAVAAKMFGISPYTLKKYGRADGGFLREGKHWERGMSRTASKGWYVEECRRALAEQGFIIFDSIKDDVALIEKLKG